MSSSSSSSECGEKNTKLVKTRMERKSRLAKKKHDKVQQTMLITKTNKEGRSTQLEVYWKSGKEDKKMKVCRGFLRTASRWNHAAWKKNISNGILNIPHLKLCEIPETIYTFETAITIAYIHDNNLECLPENFFEKLPMLAWLDLRNNRMKSFPNLKSEHKNLRVLNLKGNKLTSLPYSLVLARELKSINVEDNPLKDPPEQVVNIGSKAILDYLDLRYQSNMPAFDSPQYQLYCVPEDDEDSTNSEHDNITRSFSKFPSEIITDSEHGQRIALEKLKDYNSSISLTPKWLHKKTYSMGLWQDMPYHGHSAQTIMKQAISDFRTEKKKKVRKDQEIILQRMKDREVLVRWRENTHLRQLYGPEYPLDWNIPAPPFGTDIYVDIDTDIQGRRPRNVVGLDEFDLEFKNIIQDLREFAENLPTDSTEAQQRLTKLEEVRDRLLSMKIEEKSFCVPPRNVTRNSSNDNGDNNSISYPPTPPYSSFLLEPSS